MMLPSTARAAAPPEVSEVDCAAVLPRAKSMPTGWSYQLSSRAEPSLHWPAGGMHMVMAVPDWVSV